MTHFERLGLPQRFDLGAGDVERAFLVASRAVHPDHHAGGQEDTAAVNAAYHTLRDPFRRAEYLLGLVASGVSSPSPDAAFLMEMMEARERAEAGDVSVAGQLSAKLAGLTAVVGHQFAGSDFVGVMRSLSAAKTVRSLLREVAGD